MQWPVSSPSQRAEDRDREYGSIIVADNFAQTLVHD